MAVSTIANFKRPAGARASSRLLRKRIVLEMVPRKFPRSPIIEQSAWCHTSAPARCVVAASTKGPLLPGVRKLSTMRRQGITAGAELSIAFSFSDLSSVSFSANASSANVFPLRLLLQLSLFVEGAQRHTGSSSASD